MLASNAIQIVGIFPILRAGANNVVGNTLLQKVWFRAILEGPVIPLLVKVVEVEHGSLAKGQAAYLFVGSAGPSMIPRTNNQVVVLLCWRTPVLHVLTVIGHRSRLISVIVASNSQNGNAHLRVLILCGSHRLPVVVVRGMLQPFLKGCAHVPDNGIEGGECRLSQVQFARLLDPKWG